MKKCSLILIIMFAYIFGINGCGSSGTNTYTISGKVADSTGTGISGVSINISGSASSTATTDSSGSYSFTGFANGNYTITPSKTDYTFTPSSRSVTVSSANITGQDFVGVLSVLTGIWNGTYTYDCKQNAFPPSSSAITMEITQHGEQLSGTASYLGSITSLTGKITVDQISIKITESSSITQNWFTGTLNGNNISGTTLNGEGCSAPTGPTGSFNITKSSLLSNSPAKLKIVGPSTYTNETCATYTVEVQDNSGNPSTTNGDVTIVLSGGGLGNFYQDNICSTQINSLVIPTGGMSQNFFFKDSAAEAITLTISDKGGYLTGDNLIVAVTATGGTIMFSLDGVPVVHSVNASAYYWEKGTTTFIDGNDAIGNYFSMYISGVVGGTYSCGNMYYQDNTGKQWGAGGSIGGTCNVTITNYGNVGQLINGTFSGTLVAQFGGATGTKAITNGNFSIMREPDN